MRNIFLAGLVAIVALSACEHKESAAEANKKFSLSDTMQHMIQLDTVKISPMTGELSLSGVVEYNDNNVVKVYPRSSGQVIVTKVSVGDLVSEGQTLAIVKSADVAGNYSDLTGANADVSIAKRQMDNVESLYKNGINSEKEYNEAKQNYEKAVAARNKIQSLININGGGKTNSGGEYVITAPRSGYVVEKKVSAGAFIRNDMGDNLFTISDLKNVWVYANVYEADISRIKEGFDVKVIPLSYPDRVFAGKINKISQALDAQSKALKVRIDLDNKDLLLKPEMFTKVVVNNKDGGSAICIPATAILSQDGKNYVVVYKSNDDMSIAEVNVLKTVGDHAYLKDGVKEGQLLITKNQLFIFNQLLGE